MNKKMIALHSMLPLKLKSKGYPAAGIVMCTLSFSDIPSKIDHDLFARLFLNFTDKKIKIIPFIKYLFSANSGLGTGIWW